METKNVINKLFKNDMKNIIKKFIIPNVLIEVVKYYKYRRYFNEAYVSYKANVNLDKDIHIGRNVFIYKDVEIDVFRFKIGDYSTISGPTNIVGIGSVKIGKYCSIAPGVYMVTNNHNYSNLTTFQMGLINGIGDNDHIVDEIYIGNDVWIGKNVIILPGVNIDDGCIVAAGTVVTKGYYEPYSIIGGVPAKVIKRRFSAEIIEEIKKNNIFEKDIQQFIREYKKFEKRNYGEN